MASVNPLVTRAEQLANIRQIYPPERRSVERPAFRLSGAPYTSVATLVFVGAVLVLMAFDYPVGTFAVASIGLIAPALVLGWFVVRRKVNDIADIRR
ncbi:hypothetical protein GCM10011581_40600 [Saccharopolyspora subtropica]|uniref:Uncharacterized protein n=1 Tax=Saccharopolyspora thermophila TaxID=89367 RepID=A0A917K409_9PSEU|nr:hypothetical protein [Saccharopolyspora subtropica]GGI99289.1 hypothetical protein GCM10011581_40600 [Saccharopolyspora subtropica]